MAGLDLMNTYSSLSELIFSSTSECAARFAFATRPPQAILDCKAKSNGMKVVMTVCFSTPAWILMLPPQCSPDAWLSSSLSRSCHSSQDGLLGFFANLRCLAPDLRNRKMTRRS